MATPARSVENLRKNLRALIQELVVETRKPTFKPENASTQNLLLRFARQAHKYQVSASNKLNANQALANIKGNAAAVATAAASVEKAARTNNSTPQRLRNVLNRTLALLARIRSTKPVANAAITNKQNIIGRPKFPVFLPLDEKKALVKAYLAKKRNQVKNREFLKKRGFLARGWQNENLTRFWAAVNAQMALNAQGVREAAKVRKTEEDTRKALIKQIIRWNARRAPGAPFNISKLPYPPPGNNKMKIINKQKFKNNMTTAFKGRNQNVNTLFTAYFPWPQVPSGGTRREALATLASL